MHPRPLVLGHRGAPDAAAENTLESFRIALAMGADGVELDVRRTRDGNLVVHHDASASGVGVLADRSLREVRAARPEIPTLEESLAFLEGALVNVEIKNFPQDPDFDPSQRVVDDVVALLHARSGTDRVIVSSFNLGAVDRVRALDDTVATGFLTLLGFDPLDACTVAADRGHAALHPDVRSLPGPIAPAVVERAAALGLAVNTWTVDAPEEVVRLAAAGVDAIITNRPDVARRALA